MIVRNLNVGTNLKEYACVGDATPCVGCWVLQTNEKKNLRVV